MEPLLRMVSLRLPLNILFRLGTLNIDYRKLIFDRWYWIERYRKEYGGLYHDNIVNWPTYYLIYERGCVDTRATVVDYDISMQLTGKELKIFCNNAPTLRIRRTTIKKLIALRSNFIDESNSDRDRILIYLDDDRSIYRRRYRYWSKQFDPPERLIESVKDVNTIDDYYLSILRLDGTLSLGNTNKLSGPQDMLVSSGVVGFSYRSWNSQLIRLLGESNCGRYYGLESSKCLTMSLSVNKATDEIIGYVNYTGGRSERLYLGIDGVLMYKKEDSDGKIQRTYLHNYTPWPIIDLQLVDNVYIVTLANGQRRPISKGIGTLGYIK